ncbi:DNA alkylation repair protein [Paenibacillus sp. LMG 31456]|uniref:DNA alkylation repair protein n=1 Tax=Paenibacillus foliorum TaxID=2654974 RepID=A0A972JXZ8_9BACL|nr:DNA alkylation repair protein [Paenibacillus foliorum]NOU93009.1 DNA alkylation repair protein [Paenibacillus foliorum]
MSYSYSNRLENWLRAHANSEKASPMEAYMRNLFPFLGIKSPDRVKLVKAFIQEHGIPPQGEELTCTIRELWQLPEREFHYTALQLLEKHLKKLEPAAIDLLEELVVTHSWWDTVDTIAGRLIGSYFTQYPDLIPVYTERWINSDNMWLQRSALLFQLSYKKRTDEALLFDYIRRTAHSKEFFLRKAIGWALRQYAKTNEPAVRQFVSETELSPLSVREALKHSSTVPTT